MRGQLGDVGKLLTWPSMVLTDVLAEICMSAGPNRVAPVSRPETARTADIIRCSMNGRAMMTSSGIHTAGDARMFVIIPATVLGTTAPPGWPAIAAV